jgi:hypothetical protein
MNIHDIRALILKHSASLKFNEKDHRYFLNETNLKPVSNCIKEFYPEFNVDAIAAGYARKTKRKVEDIKKEWDQKRDKACDLGNKTHKFAESYFYNKLVVPDSAHEIAVVNFWNDLPSHIIPLLSEVRVHNTQFGFAGTIDNLFYNEKLNCINPTDWKTNENIYKNFRGQKMFKPFDFLLDSPFSHYELQLSYYRIPLEDLGLNIGDQFIIWLKPDGTYEKIKATDYSGHLRYYHSLKNIDL